MLRPICYKDEDEGNKQKYLAYLFQTEKESFQDNLCYSTFIFLITKLFFPPQGRLARETFKNFYVIIIRPVSTKVSKSKILVFGKIKPVKL